MQRNININFSYLFECWKNQEFDSSGVITKGKRGVVLEGSSRSRKTYSIIDFFILLFTRYETNCTLNIIKETYNEFKTTLYDDFNNRLTDFGLDNPFKDKQEVKSFKILGNKINFLGSDKDSKFHGSSCDYFWINEALPVAQSIFDQSEMRCRKFWVMDFNPSVSEHYIFNKVLTRPDVGYLHSTFRTNIFCPPMERAKIMSYEPTPENITNGTADDYMWKVYGLGLRTAVKGLIFPYVTWIDSFPEIPYVYGLDFGFTNDPTCITKVGVSGNNLYIEILLYEPIDNAPTLSDYMDKKGIRRDIVITADSSDKYNDVEMVRDLKNLSWIVKKVNKGKGVIWSIGQLKQHKIHIVSNVNAKREQENYKWREVNGISLNEPIDKFNHMWDSVRYGYLGMNKSPSIIW